MKRHRPRKPTKVRPNKSNPVRLMAKGEKLEAGQHFNVNGDKYGRTYWCHPTKGWRSRAGVRT